MEDLKKIVKQFQDFGFLVKGFTKIVENRTKEKKRLLTWYAIWHIRCRFIDKYAVGKRVTDTRQGGAYAQQVMELSELAME